MSFYLSDTNDGTVMNCCSAGKEKKDQLKLLLGTGAAEQQMRGDASYV